MQRGSHFVGGSLISASQFASPVARRQHSRWFRQSGRTVCLLPVVWGVLLALATCAQAAEWTILVYLDADNNLHYAGLDDLAEMQQVGSNANVNVVVQWDGYAGYGDGNGGTARYYIRPGQRQLVQDLGELNMGSPQTLIDFVKWGMDTYPASHYAVVLWNHGDGWRSRSRSRAPQSSGGSGAYPPYKAVAWDDSNGSDALYMNEVRSALAQIQTQRQAPELLGFDACLMAMAEVAYEIQPYASVMVASEESEPNEGWPYHTILQDLTATPTMSAAELGGSIVNRYGQFFASQTNCTLSAIDLTKVSGVAAALDTFADAMMSGWDPQIESARSQTQTFLSPRPGSFGEFDDNADLYHFADLVSVSAPQLASAANGVKAALQAAVIQEWHNMELAGANGLAVYFPSAKPLLWPGDYTAATIEFPGLTQWDEFLTLYFDTPPSAPILNPPAATKVGTPYQLSWAASADSDGISAYALQETDRYDLPLNEDGESGNTNWTLNGFTLSAGQYNSYSHAYYGGAGNNLNNRMQLVSGVPIPSGSGATLSFWVSYDIESGYDYAYAEVSADGATWTPLATFTGQQTGWKQYQYDLTSVVGSTVWVRFRYVTDYIVYGAGLFVDDIQVAAYAPFTTLSSSIAAVSYTHPGQTYPGSYYYRARAKDAPGKWGPWSNVVPLLVSRPPVDHLEIKPDSATVAVGGTRQFVATAYDSGNQEIVGVTYAWSVLTGGGSLDATGLFTAGQSAGSFPDTIRAMADGKVDTASVEVTPGPLKSLAVIPSTATVAAGKVRKFVATGYDQYGNEVPNLNVQWGVLNGGGTIDAAGGDFTAQTEVGEFSRTVQAMAEGIKGLASVKVVPADIADLQLSPDPGSATVGETVQFTATAQDQYGNEITGVPFEWSLTAGGTIDSNGLVQAAGTADVFTDAVTATSGSVSANATLIVNARYSYRAGKQIVAVPTTLPGVDAATVFGTQKLAKWDPAAGTFRMYAAAPFNVAAGEAYVANLPAAMEAQVPGAPPAGEVSLDLSAGTWHLIGNPFDVPLEWDVDTIRYQQNRGPWSQLRNVIGTQNRPVEFYVWKLSPMDSSYRVVCGNGVLPTGESRIGVGEGAWIHTGGAGVRLSLTRPTRVAPPRQTAPSAAADGWAVELIARVGDACDRSNYLGLSSRYGPDGLNLPGPPAIAEQFVELALAPANTAGPRSLAMALSGENLTRATWNMDVTTNVVNGQVTLSWPDLSALPRNCRLRLVDLVTGRAVSMRSASAYTYRAENTAVSRRQFRVELTPASESRLQLSAVSLNGAAGGRGATRVSFVLNRDANVRWQLRSSTGRAAVPASTVAAKAGPNSFALNVGRSSQTALAPGLYLLELVASDDEGGAVRAVKALAVR